MNTSSSTSFAVASRHASALDSKSNQKGHGRLESRSHSFAPLNSEPVLSKSSSTRSNVDPPRIGATRISLTSNSKIWSKHRKTVPKSTYDRLLQIVFFICLILFLRALSGSGVPPDPNISTGSATMPHARVYASRIARPEGQISRNNHLAVDLDGHYSLSIEFDDVRARAWSQWGKRDSEYAAVTPKVKEQDSDAGEEIEGVPEPTPDNNFENVGITDSPHTPPPVTPPVASDDVIRAAPEQTEKPDGDREAEAEMDLPLFVPGDPAYPLRVHLPKTKSIIEEHKHGRKRHVRSGSLY